jgi:hypothetical protein
MLLILRSVVILFPNSSLLFVSTNRGAGAPGAMRAHTSTAKLLPVPAAAASIKNSGVHPIEGSFAEQGAVSRPKHCAVEHS